MIQPACSLAFDQVVCVFFASHQLTRSEQSFLFCPHDMCIEAGGWANLEVGGWKGEGEPCVRRESFTPGKDGAPIFPSPGGHVQLPHRRAFFFV